VDNRTEDELREERQRFGEVCEAKVREAREAGESVQSESATERQELAEDLQRSYVGSHSSSLG
jgi:hypothetical protein